MRKIVITGALGHIGSGLVPYLQNKNPEISLLLIDNMSTQRYGVFSHFKPGFDFQEIDVRSKKINALFDDADLVIHLGAITDASGTAKTPEIVFDNNLTATQNLAEICSKVGVKFIFPSSTSVYGSQELLVDESTSALNPQSPYAECKLLEEKLISDMGSLAIVYRLGTIHGVSPGMRFHTAVNKFCWQAAWGKDITVWETAMDQVRPYLALQDFYASIHATIRNYENFAGETINLVSENQTPRDILTKIQKHRSISIKYVQDPIMNQFSYAVSNQKALNSGLTFGRFLDENIESTLQYLSVI